MVRMDSMRAVRDVVVMFLDGSCGGSREKWVGFGINI